MGCVVEAFTLVASALIGSMPLPQWPGRVIEPAPKTREVNQSVIGGVLIIDEACYLYRAGHERDYDLSTIGMVDLVPEPVLFKMTWREGTSNSWQHWGIRQIPS